VRVNPGNVPYEVRANGGVLSNDGPGTVYYGDRQDFSQATALGSLTAGQSTILNGSLWLIAPSAAADVQVTGGDSSTLGALVGQGGRSYKIVSGVLRNNGATAYFQPLDTGGHRPQNIDSCSTTASIIQVRYDSIGAGNVVALFAQPDEVYANQGFTLGCSVGLQSTDITVYRQRHFSDRIYYDGAAWQRASGSSNSPFLVGSFTAGVLRVTHATVGANNPYGVSLTAGTAPLQPILNGTINDTTMDISWVDSTRTVVTTASTNMSVFITRPQFKPEPIDPRTMATSSFPNSNIWLWGLFEA